MRGCGLLSLRLAALAVVLCAFAATGGASAQERVGISSAVNPQALGTPPGAATQPLLIGQTVVFNERITTANKGQTQLLFVDESSMTVGPNSDLTIDQFVYDPKTGTGRLAMSATRGLLRYVGGKLSKHDGAVTLRTSTATLAVRGGAFIFYVTPTPTPAGVTPPNPAQPDPGPPKFEEHIVFVYGDGLTISALNGAVETLARAGYEVTISPLGNLSPPHPVPPGRLGELTALLDGEAGQTGGASNVPNDAAVDLLTAPLNQTLSQSLENLVNGTFVPPQNAGNAQTTYNQQPNIFGIACASGGNNCTIVFGGGTSTFSSPSGTQPGTITTNYGGQVTGTTDTAFGFNSLAPPSSTNNLNGTVAYSAGSLTYTAGSPQDAVFSGTFGNFGSISFPLPLCSSSSGGCSTSFGPAGTSSPFGTFSGTTFMSSDDGFFYATITPTSDPSAKLFVFGGAPVDPSFYQPTGSTRIFAFTVQPDAALQSNIPFIRAQAGGNLPNAAVSPLYIVAPATTAIGDATTVSAARALQASLAISGQGASQQSVIAVTTGSIDALQSNGQPLLAGQMRGSSMLSATGTPTTLNSAVSTTVDGNGNTFYGSNSISGFVLDQTEYNPVAGSGVLTSSGTGMLTGPAANSAATETTLSGTTTSYGFAQPALPTGVPAGVGANRTTQTLSGYFGGLMYTNEQSTPYTIAGNATIMTDASSNRIQAQLTYQEPDCPTPGVTAPSAGVSSLTLNYGGLSGSAGSREAFIDDNNFGVLESASVPQYVNESQSNGQLYLVSSGATTQPANPSTGQAAVNPASALLPASVSFCQCQYLQWGYWGGSLTTPTDGPTRIDVANINTWVAGTPTPPADLNTLESMRITARYTGASIGSVYNNGASYLAAGGFTGTYNFGTGWGSFTVNNFDNHSFTASGRAPLTGATYSFAGSAHGFAGSVNGSFYGPMAAETGGNFAFRSTSGVPYLASGIFAGSATSRIPPPP
jgi:trimeric autotransporter adhesin